jgi:hypothetical protein
MIEITFKRWRLESERSRFEKEMTSSRKGAAKKKVELIADLNRLKRPLIKGNQK